MANYLALLRKNPDSEFGVSFPDFPGCVTAGSTLEEARIMAAEALAFHIEGMIEDGDPVPPPSDLDSVMADPDSRDAVALLVSLAEMTPKTVRVNITLPENDLAAIDAYAAAHGFTRSGLLLAGARRLVNA